jgi:hypothetical protein
VWRCRRSPEIEAVPATNPLATVRDGRTNDAGHLSWKGAARGSRDASRGGSRWIRSRLAACCGGALAASRDAASASDCRPWQFSDLLRVGRTPGDVGRLPGLPRRTRRPNQARRSNSRTVLSGRAAPALPSVRARTAKQSRFGGARHRPRGRDDRSRVPPVGLASAIAGVSCPPRTSCPAHGGASSAARQVVQVVLRSLVGRRAEIFHAVHVVRARRGGARISAGRPGRSRTSSATTTRRPARSWSSVLATWIRWCSACCGAISLQRVRATCSASPP